MSLERVGKMTVEVVGDPTKAIEAMTGFHPDLVMLDWMMPAMDGPTLFREMKLRQETQALPVVFITAKAAQRDLDELMKMGAAGTISKPFNPKDLPDQLRAIWAKLP
jgi:CheY-like chemotaxis protein